MDKIRQALKTTYNYSDYELELVKYTLLSIASEFSKILLLYIFYIIIGKALSFTVFILLLSLIRFNSGGFHCKHYTTCLLLTFVISGSSYPSTIDNSGYLIYSNYYYCLYHN